MFDCAVCAYSMYVGYVPFELAVVLRILLIYFDSKIKEKKNLQQIVRCRCPILHGVPNAYWNKKTEHDEEHEEEDGVE